MKEPESKRIEYKDKTGAIYETWQVTWYDSSGKRQRKQFKNRSAASLFKSEIHTQLHNEGASRRSLSTKLTEAQLSEAEACFDRLAGAYSLTECVNHFLASHRDPGSSISISDVSRKWLDAKSKTCRPATVNRYQYFMKGFSSFCNNRLLHEVDTELIESFVGSFQNKTTKANARAFLSSLFGWCSAKPQKYINHNIVADTQRYKADQGEIDVLSASQCEELMRYVEAYKDGRMVRYFAIALFAGVRPDGELKAMAKSGNGIHLENLVIRITPEVSKVHERRQITIQNNLEEWLLRYPGEILPKNFERHYADIRKEFRLSRDVMRHTFCSMHVMAFGSFAETAIEAGNSESVIRSNYFNRVTKTDAARFWSIFPSVERDNIVPMVSKNGSQLRTMV